MRKNSSERLLPRPSSESQHFWDGTKEGELRLQRCGDCGKSYFPPRPFCPFCSSRNVSVYPASGQATLYSYVINHLPTPGFDGPHAVAVVTLEEGPRMMTNIVDCEQTPDTLVLDMPLEVTFERQNDDITLPLFKPAS